MKGVMSARQWKEYRGNQESMIVASTGGKLSGSRNYLHPRFTEMDSSEMDFSQGVRTLHYGADGQPTTASKSR